MYLSLSPWASGQETKLSQRQRTRGNKRVMEETNLGRRKRGTEYGFLVLNVAWVLTLLSGAASQGGRQETSRVFHGVQREIRFSNAMKRKHDAAPVQEK